MLQQLYLSIFKHIAHVLSAYFFHMCYFFLLPCTQLHSHLAILGQCVEHIVKTALNPVVAAGAPSNCNYRKYKNNACNDGNKSKKYIVLENTFLQYVEHMAQILLYGCAAGCKPTRRSNTYGKKACILDACKVRENRHIQFTPTRFVVQK